MGVSQESPQEKQGPSFPLYPGIEDDFEAHVSAIKPKSSTAVSLSVFVSTSGNPELLAPCLESLSRQTIRKEKIEVLVADTDCTGSADSIRSQFLDVRFLAESGSSTPVCWSRFGREASGKFLVHLSDDIVADPGWAEAICAAFEENPGVVAVQGQVLPEPGEGQQDPPSHHLDSFLGLADWGDESCLISWPLDCLPCAVFRRDWIEKACRFEVPLIEGVSFPIPFLDAEMLRRINKVGSQVFYCSEAHLQRVDWKKESDSEAFVQHELATRLAQTVLAMMDAGQWEECRALFASAFSSGTKSAEDIGFAKVKVIGWILSLARYGEQAKEKMLALGDAMTRCGEFGLAETIFRRCMKEFPETEDFNVCTGGLLRERKHYTSLNAVFPKKNVLSKLGTSFRGNAAGAEQFLIDHLVQAPNDMEAMLSLGGFYLRNGRLNDSLSVLQHAVDVEPENPAALFLLTETASALMRPEVAKTAFARLETLVPRDPRVQVLGRKIALLQSG